MWRLLEGFCGGRLLSFEGASHFWVTMRTYPNVVMGTDQGCCEPTYFQAFITVTPVTTTVICTILRTPSPKPLSTLIPKIVHTILGLKINIKSGP